MSQKKKTINRVEKNRNYSVIHNHGPHDEQLTWGARGLLTYMLTKPDDFAFYNEELAKHSPESIWKVKELIKELKSFGYIKRIPEKDPATNKIIKWSTILYEIPLEPDVKELQDQDADHDESKGPIPEAEKPEGGIPTSGENPLNTPEVGIPSYGKPGGVESHTVENLPLLSTDSLLNTNLNKKTIPVGEPKAAPDYKLNLPPIQKGTAILFQQYGQKKELSADDVVCLNLLFKLHTPHAIQQGIEKAFERLKKNGVVKYLHTDGKEYEIHTAHKLPIRYIYNSMKNWSSLRGTGKGGNTNGNKESRGNNERANKNYESKASTGFFV